MNKALVLLCALCAACGNPDDALVIEASDDATLGEPIPFERAMQNCYADTTARAVHTTGRYLALGDTMMLVRVTLPEAPDLARCIEDAVMHEAPPGWSQAPDSLVNGSFAIDLGGPPRMVSLDDIVQQYDEHVQGMAALMREVVERGLLPADHRLVREALAAAETAE